MEELPNDDAAGLEVYWRPHCRYCARLMRALDGASVPYRLHNIWEDQAARDFVAAHNRGNETVPTVAIGDVVLTNPDPRALIDALEQRRSASAVDPPT